MPAWLIPWSSRKKSGRYIILHSPHRNTPGWVNAVLSETPPHKPHTGGKPHQDCHRLHHSHKYIYIYIYEQAVSLSSKPGSYHYHQRLLHEEKLHPSSHESYYIVLRYIIIWNPTIYIRYLVYIYDTPNIRRPVSSYRTPHTTWFDGTKQDLAYL